MESNKAGAYVKTTSIHHSLTYECNKELYDAGIGPEPALRMPLYLFIYSPGKEVQYYFQHGKWSFDLKLSFWFVPIFCIGQKEMRDAEDLEAGAATLRNNAT